MCNTLSIICSVALSIASTNDYRFTSPGTTNLVGRGMGPNAEYVVPRAEDIAFLREAFAERFCLLTGSTNLNQYSTLDRQLVPGGAGVAAGEFMRIWVDQYWQYAFHPTFFGWSSMSGFGGGWGDGPTVTATFVAPSFHVEPSHRETGPDYLVNGKSTDDGLSAFVGYSSAISTNLVSTNTFLNGALRSSVVAGLYSNICVNARVIHNAYHHMTRHPDTTLMPLYIRAYLWDDTRISKYTQASYEYEIGDRSYSSTYANGYITVPDPYNATTTNHYTSAYNFEMSLSRYRQTTLPYGYKVNSNYAPKKYHSVELSPLHQYDDVDKVNMDGCGKPLIRSAVLDVATNHVAEADSLIVIRLAVLNEEIWSGDTSRAGRTTTTNHYVLTNNATLRKRADSPMWELDFDFAEKLAPVINSSWVGATSWPEVDVKHPADMDDIPQTLSATHERTSTIRGIDLQLYVNFIPTFRARVL